MASRKTNDIQIMNQKKQIELLDDQQYHDSFFALVERNQIALSRNLLIVLYSLHFLVKNKAINKITTKFLYISNFSGIDPTNLKPIYDIDLDDAFYVIHWLVIITFMRSFLMKWVFEPFASKFCDIHSRKAKTRFAEQSWSFVYYSISFTYGVYLYWHSVYYNNLDQVYINWPSHYMSLEFKNYYLISIGFWLQQIFVLNVEKPRKDHYQMFSHHIITCSLMIGSYYYYFFRIGHLILMIMDSVDIFLSAAKMLKYAGFSNACDAMFILFLISWVVLRHGVYNYIFYHTWHKSVDLMKNAKCIEGLIQKRCWTDGIINTFLGLLGGLQIITCIWMYLIFKVAYKVVTGKGAEDVRSDEDDTDVEDNQEEEQEDEDEEKEDDADSLSSSSDITLDDKRDIKKTKRRA